MNFDKIENELKNISSNINKETFIYDFLLSYGLPKSSINRLKKVTIINLKLMVKLFGKKRFTLNLFLKMKMFIM